MTFEAFRDDPGGRLARLQEFLCGAKRLSSAPLRTQDTRTLCATIENHDALRDAPAGSCWAAFFDS